jgi:hypothetical protein
MYANSVKEGCIMNRDLIRLITCAIDFLILLIKRYEKNEIDYDTFHDFAKSKIILLKNCLNETESKELILMGNVIIQKYNNIIKYKKVENSVY